MIIFMYFMVKLLVLVVCMYTEESVNNNITVC